MINFVQAWMEMEYYTYESDCTIISIIAPWTVYQSSIESSQALFHGFLLSSCLCHLNKSYIYKHNSHCHSRKVIAHTIKYNTSPVIIIHAVTWLRGGDRVWLDLLNFITNWTRGSWCGTDTGCNVFLKWLYFESNQCQVILLLCF